MIKRREMIQGLIADLSSSLSAGLSFAKNDDRSATRTGDGPRRIIFFLQNHGFDPFTCIPEELAESCPLDGVTLPEPMQALAPYKDRMHVITGLHGRYTSPGHSVYFGTLGGYRGSQSVPPAGATIDYVLQPGDIPCPRMRRNRMLAYVQYDLTGNLAFAFGCFAAMASLVQMFQIGAMRRSIASLEDRLSPQKDELDVNAAETTPG